MKRNSILRKAFEEAAEKELNALPREEKVVRIYSEDFEAKMGKLFDAYGQDGKEKTVPVRRRKIKWASLVAAALMIAVFTVTASAFVKGNGIWGLLNFVPDPENYQDVDIEIKDSYMTGRDKTARKELVYDGTKITLKYNIDTGETFDWPDKGIMLYLDGVRQTFDAKTSEGDYKNIDMLHLKNEKGKVKTVEFTFEPNIGKKGEDLKLSVVAFFDPYITYYPQCKTDNKALFVAHFDDDHDDICDKCGIKITEVPSGPSSYTIQSEYTARLVMKTDAPEQTKTISGFSGEEVSKLDKEIYKSYAYSDGVNDYNDFDNIETLGISLYKDIDDAYNYHWGAQEHSLKIETKAKTEDEFTVNLHGKTGKYRVSFYIGTELQNVFDGAAYADVDVVHGEQTELTFSLDTTKLAKGDNYCYVLFESLDEEYGIFSEVMSSLVYTIKVK